MAVVEVTHTDIHLQEIPTKVEPHQLCHRLQEENLMEIYIIIKF